MESNRLMKVNQLLQQELSEIFRKEAIRQGQGVLISVTEVRTTPDLSIAKCYLSIFPASFREPLLKGFKEYKGFYRKQLGEKIGKEMRIVPDLLFFEDTTLDQVEKIEKELRSEGENPIL